MRTLSLSIPSLCSLLRQMQPMHRRYAVDGTRHDNMGRMCHSMIACARVNAYECICYECEYVLTASVIYYYASHANGFPVAADVGGFCAEDGIPSPVNAWRLANASGSGGGAGCWGGGCGMVVAGCCIGIAFPNEPICPPVIGFEFIPAPPPIIIPPPACAPMFA